MQGTQQPEVTLVIPVRNEEEVIATVLQEWAAELRALKIPFQLFVIEDGSADRTGRILEELKSPLPELRVTHHAVGAGHGPSILEGYRAAATPWIFQVDSDREMSPAAFKELWSQRETHDFLFGWRQNRRSPPARRLISVVARISVRVLFGAGLKDPNTPYRLMRRTCLQPLLQDLPADPFAPNVILAGLAVRRGLRLFQIGVPHEGRKTGSVSMVKWKLWTSAARSFLQTVAAAARARRVKRPA